MKQKCARRAFEMIKDGMIVGLGGGSTVALLIQEIEKQKKSIYAVTPSQDTMELCVKHHIPLVPLCKGRKACILRKINYSEQPSAGRMRCNCGRKRIGDL